MNAATVRRYLLGVLAIGADVDDGIIGVVVDVGHRKEEPLDADGARLAGRDLALEARQRRVAGRAEGHGLRKHGGAIHAHGSAALEVAGHQQRHARQLLHAVEERPSA
jgi:hypothetical protein